MLFHDFPLLPSTLGKAVHTKRYAVHCVAKHHAKQWDRVLRHIPWLNVDNYTESKDGECKRGYKHGSGSKGKTPPADKLALLARHCFTTSNSEHHKGYESNPEQTDVFKKGFQHHPNQKKLDCCAQCCNN